MLFHMVQSVRAESIGATARQSMDGAERGTPVENLNPSDAVVRMAHDASCRTFPGSVRALVGRPDPYKRPPGWPG